MVTVKPLIGVLALQGAFREHCRAIARCGARAVEVRGQGNDVASGDLDGLIIPGGESTTIGKLLVDTGLLEVIRALGAAGLPIYGSCAGMILLCTRLEDTDGRVLEQPHLGLLDATVRRNAFGRQRDSFECELAMDFCGHDNPFPAVFIRAPLLSGIGPGVQVLARLGEHPVAVRQGRILATAFHPELTSDLRVHRYFLNMLH